MDKPINSSLIYRKRDTNAAGTTNQSVVSFEQGNEMIAISKKILELIVQKHS